MSDTLTSQQHSNTVEMFKAIKKIFAAMIVLVLTILVVGGFLAHFIDSTKGIKSVVFATFAAFVLMFITLFVMTISAKNPSLMAPSVMFAFLFKILFVIVFLFLVRKNVDVNNHIFSISLIVAMLFSAFIESYFLLKAKFKYQ